MSLTGTIAHTACEIVPKKHKIMERNKRKIIKEKPKPHWKIFGFVYVCGVIVVQPKRMNRFAKMSKCRMKNRCVRWPFVPTFNS